MYGDGTILILCVKRQRYRIIDQDRLLFPGGFKEMRAFADFYARSISERLDAGRFVREPWWTEAVAVGDRAFLDDVEQTVTYRQQLERYEVASPGNRKTWAVREPSMSYGADSDS